MAKKFDFNKYKSIDYRKWILGDRAREGANIKRLGILNEGELKVWNYAIPYQDQRNDPGQGEIVTYFAIEFLKYFKGDRGVVVPTAILHDTGWYYGDAKAWKKLVKSSGMSSVGAILKATDTEEQRRPHQNRGNLIAGRILERAGWPEKYDKKIADIIGDHDTRKLPTTESGRIVRAADILWRVSYPCLQAYYRDSPVSKILEVCEGTALYMPSPRNLRSIELEIAKIEMVNTLFFKFGDVAEPVLKLKYEKELIKIIYLYKHK